MRIGMLFAVLGEKKVRLSGVGAEPHRLDLGNNTLR